MTVASELVITILLVVVALAEPGVQVLEELELIHQ
jgi:hypothetical protein